ncbi:Hypothetical predicted protein [Podarcis lilfordi]|uniref:Uncharacterized protein n=1 Tax=Podarcis lilfordi TaxID=74358 RepID=A0AA35KYQ6_9SAUR|nr:Hypothetical predicted protein [Podarcis lilfordi]
MLCGVGVTVVVGLWLRMRRGFDAGKKWGKAEAVDEVASNVEILNHFSPGNVCFCLGKATSSEPLRPTVSGQ